MKNILILGGTGYIGNCLSSNLNRDYNVSIVGTSTKNKFIIGEEVDKEIFKNINIVLYLSWSFDLRNKYYSEQNINSFKTVVDVCKERNIKLFFISTYYANKDSLSIYNRTKAHCEDIAIESGFKVIRLGSVILNNITPGGVYGNISNFYNKYKIFPIFLPNKKKFYLTNSDNLNSLCKDLSTIDKNISYYCSDKSSTLFNLFNLNNKFLFKVYIPWKIVFWVLLFSEKIGIKLKFHSQNLVSIWAE